MSAAHYDIAVIGAGPAGCMFARNIGKDFSVFLLDRKRGEGRLSRKPCGGLLTRKSLSVLAEHGLRVPDSLLVYPQLKKVRTISLDTGRIRYYRRNYMNMDRRLFDAWLLASVPDRVRVEIGSCRSVENDGGVFRIRYSLPDGSKRSVTCDHVVGADGADSIIRKSFFTRPSRSCIAIQQWFEENQQPGYACIFDPDTSPFCSWSVSKNGIMIFGGAFETDGCRSAFEAQKNKLAAYGYDFSSPVRAEACLMTVPRRLSDICLGHDGVYLAGEAAGLISPSSFEGISYALRSGAALAEAFNSGSNVQARYDRACQPLRLALLEKLCKRPFMYSPALRRMVMGSGLFSVR